MKPNQNPNQQNTNEQENSQQQGGMAAPEAASRRDVEEAERKAQEAKAKATEEAERTKQELREEIEELRQEKEELRDDLLELRRIVDILDLRQMDVFDKAKHKALGKSFSVDQTAREKVKPSDEGGEEEADA